MKNLHLQSKQENLNLNSELKNLQNKELSYLAEIRDLKSRCKHISTTTTTTFSTTTTTKTTTTTTSTVEGCGLSDSKLIEPMKECWDKTVRQKSARKQFRSCFEVYLFIC